MKRGIVFIFTLFFLALLFVGCSKTVATVDGIRISQKEVNDYVNVLKNLDETGELYSGEEQLKELEANVIDSFIVIKLLEKYADENDITITDEEVDGLIQEMINDYESEEEFEKALKEQSMDREFLEYEIRSRLLSSKVYDKVTADVNVTDADVENYYQDNKDTDFLVPASVEAAHILAIFPWKAAGSGESESEEGKREAREKIEMIEQKLEEGEDFEELAKQYSDDTGTAQNGGSLGYVSKEQMVKEFDEALFSLDEGEISGIVETEYGFHIIKSYDYKEEYIQEFEDVSESIREFLLSSSKGVKWEEFIYSLIDNAEIEYAGDIEGNLNAGNGEEK